MEGLPETLFLVKRGLRWWTSQVRCWALPCYYYLHISIFLWFSYFLISHYLTLTSLVLIMGQSLTDFKKNSPEMFFLETMICCSALPPHVEMLNNWPVHWVPLWLNLCVLFLVLTTSLFPTCLKIDYATMPKSWWTFELQNVYHSFHLQLDQLGCFLQ